MKIIAVELEASVSISVRFRADLLIRAEENASVEKAVRSWAKGKHYTKADVKGTSLIEVLQVGGEPVEDFNLGQALSSTLGSGQGGIEIKDFMVTDSR